MYFSRIRRNWFRQIGKTPWGHDLDLSGHVTSIGRMTIRFPIGNLLV